MPLNPEQIKRRQEAREKLPPQERQTKALEDMADTLTNIYLLMVSNSSGAGRGSSFTR